MFTSKVAQDSVGLSELKVAVLKQRKLSEYLQCYNMHMTRDLHTGSSKLTTNWEIYESANRN